MYSSLNDVEFLSRSSNRVEVFNALDGEPRTRDELDEVTDASRVTLDRILDDLEERGWITRSGRRYESTPQGTYVASELERLLTNEEPLGESENATRKAATEFSLADVGFLARSSNRIEVLDAICPEPRTRDELGTLIDTSPATLSRILDELEDRGWIDRTNHRCEPTPRGREVAAAFSRLLSNLEVAEALDEVLGWLPTDEFEFGLRCLGDAEVIPADYWEDPTRSIHHVAELVRSADHAWIVGPGAAREVADSVRTLTVKRDGTFVGIMEPQGVETIRNDEVLRKHFQAILASGRATIAYQDQDRPFLVVAIVDDTVVLCGSEDRDVAHDTVETDHERVRTWAESYVEAVKAKARPLNADDFTA